jgi:hypothetical protein
LDGRGSLSQGFRNPVERAILRRSVEPTDNPSRNLGAFGELSDVGHVFLRLA